MPHCIIVEFKYPYYYSRVAIQSMERTLCHNVDGCVETELPLSPSVGLSVGLSVWKVHYGKTADWIWMPFGVVMGSIEGWAY